jgi:peptide/nickel transport system substrate-binding protein
MRRSAAAAVLLAAAVMILPVSQTFAQTTVSYARQLQGSIDPAGSYSAEDAETMHGVYETLINIDAKGQIHPGLAVSWTVSPDFQTYTFKLRQGVKFHDGRPLSAEAVKFSLVRMLKIDKAPYGSFRSLGDENGVEAVDPTTVRIRLKKPFPLFMADLVAPSYFIVSDGVMARATADDPYAAKWMTTNAVGTGPFRLAEWLQDQRVVLEKFPDYWGGTGTPKSKARVDRVVVQKVTDPSAARIMLEKGEVDITEKLTDEQFAALRQTQGIVVKAFDRPQVSYLTMDIRQKPFDSMKVRQALAYAVNYEELISRILRGNAKPLHGLVAEGLLGFDRSIPSYKYDPAKAQQLLKEAGNPNGFATDLFFAPGRAIEFDQVAEYLQAYLGKVGVQAKLEKMTIEAQTRKMAAGAYGLSLMTWKVAFNDPDDSVGWIYDASRDAGGWTASFWMDPVVIEKMKKTRETADANTRAALYREVSRMAVEQAIFVPLYQPQWVLAWRSSLKNLTWDPFMGVHMWEVSK